MYLYFILEIFCIFGVGKNIHRMLKGFRFIRDSFFISLNRDLK